LDKAAACLYYENFFGNNAEKSSGSQPASSSKKAQTSKTHSTTQGTIEKSHHCRNKQATHPSTNKKQATRDIMFDGDGGHTFKILRYHSINHMLLECMWDLIVDNWVAAEEVKAGNILWRIVDHGIDGPRYRPS
jgi:hypothetical protein